MASQNPLSTLRISVADMVHLRVRTKGPGHDVRPELLYQELPIESMSIMGTIPRGTLAVSIPHHSVLGCGHAIARTPPRGDGFVIIYARQPNSRYEAVSVLFRGETIGIADFHEDACQWISREIGCLKPIPGRYAYFAPTRDHWGVILRDSGYAVLDPSIVPNTITRKLSDYGKSQNGEILARIPVHAGHKLPPDVALPVFAQVELTLDPHPNSRSLWIGFGEYQEARALRSLPPASMVPDFLEWLETLTAGSGLESWVFRPGMLFRDKIEWWGDGNRRRTEHEGIDFAEGLQPDAKLQRMPEGVPVYSMADGDVVSILDDFLGKTVVMRHPEITNESGDVFYAFFSHIQPASDRLGSIAKGRLLGRVGKSTNATTPAHLHLTGAWIPRAIHAGAITIDHLHPANTSVVLINFNDLINSSPLCVHYPSAGA